MPLHLLVGPAASGRTTRLLALARAELRGGGERVWWVALPAQRSTVYRRATRGGSGEGGEGVALLGLEVLSAQQLYYRLLASARALRPLVVGSQRLVLVGEALAEVAGQVPAPGEARLFAYAIAEAKRFGVTPTRLSDPEDPERERLVRVFAAYERLKGERWDYDDFRTQALALARERPTVCEADVLIVDGFRELGPLELRLLRALAEAREVHLSLPREPEGVRFDAVERLDAGTAPRLERYRAANPVAEARWVLRSLKRDLAETGYDPLDLAIVAPRGRAPALAALADEYGLPLMDETPRSLADTLEGRLLVELLALPDYPTPSRLLALPGLERLANAALDAGVAGTEALTALAAELGLRDAWEAWRDRLEVGEDPSAWAGWLVGTVLPQVLAGAGGVAVAGGPTRAAPAGDTVVALTPVPAARGADPAFGEAALRKGQEAARLARGPAFRAWWAALLQQARAPRELLTGIALLDATLVSGRHFARVYLMGATEGAFGAGEAEDYFVPEEARGGDGAQVGVLPSRFQGRDEELSFELLRRGDEVVVTAAEADQGGPMVADPALLGEAPRPPPAVPAGSPLELPAEVQYRAQRGPLDLGRATVERLRRFDRCAFRAWGERMVPESGELSWWRGLLGALRERKRLDPARLEELRGAYPEAAGWLAQHAATLERLTFGVRLPEGEDGPQADIDAALREGTRAVLYRFTAPERVHDEGEADAYVKSRWNELWAAGHMLERYPGRIERVDVVVWPVLGAPIDAFPRGIRYPWRTIAFRRGKAAEAFERYRAGEVEPSPGYHCRDCPVFDLCREGWRA